jgi:hypothetical protein
MIGVGARLDILIRRSRLDTPLDILISRLGLDAPLDILMFSNRR